MTKSIIAVLLIVAAGIFPATAQSSKASDKNQGANQRIVEISTEYGKMKVRLYNETPLHRDNFIKHASAGFYDGTLFHRVIPQFMIQGGDPDSKTAKPGQQLGSGDVGYTVPAEFNDKLYHKKGTLCAARTNNPEKASSGSQFYLVTGKTFTEAELTQMEQRGNFKYTPEQMRMYMTVGGTPHLDRNYTVYGEVIEGLEVLDKIGAVKTLPGDRPENDVKMTVKVIK